MKKRAEVATFEPIPGQPFRALDAAKAWCKERGFVTGSQQRGAPIGIHRESQALGISKWRGMTAAEHDGLDGIMETATGSFRDETVYIKMYPGVLEEVSGE